MMPHRALALLLCSSCAFDSSGLGSEGSASIGDDDGKDPTSTTSTTDAATSTTLSPTTSTTIDPDTGTPETSADPTTSAGDTSGGESSSSTTGAPAVEVCNGIDDDEDGAIDEHSPENPACNGCDYQVLDDGVTVQSLCTDPRPWEEAQAHCETLGGTLAVILGNERNEAVYGSTAGLRAYIGLSDRRREGNWRWVDGEDDDAYDAWAASQPNDVTTAGEDCAIMMPDAPTWNDIACGDSEVFVCHATR